MVQQIFDDNDRSTCALMRVIRKQLQCCKRPAEWNTLWA
jgi:hypothetical protein